MAAKYVEMYSGSDSILAAEQLRLATLSRREQWPYVHIEAPPNAKDVTVFGAAPTGIILGSPVTTVLTYQVNAGKRFYLRSVLLGANVGIVPGQALFTVTRNSTPNVINAQFQPEHGLVNVPYSVGSPVYGPWRLERAREFAALDVVRVQAVNVGLSIGDPTWYVCGIFGYEVPSLDVQAKK